MTDWSYKWVLGHKGYVSVAQYRTITLEGNNMTTNKEELKKQAAKLKEELDKLEELINKPDQKLKFSAVYLEKPPLGSVYHYIDGGVRVGNTFFDNVVIDVDNYNAGNFYETKKEAETVLLNRKIHHDLIRKFKTELIWGEDWEAEAVKGEVRIGKFFITFDRVIKNQVTVGLARTEYNPNTIYFITKEAVITAMNYITTKYGEQALKDYVTVGLI